MDKSWNEPFSADAVEQFMGAAGGVVIEALGPLGLPGELRLTNQEEVLQRLDQVMEYRRASHPHLEDDLRRLHKVFRKGLETAFEKIQKGELIQKTSE